MNRFFADTFYWVALIHRKDASNRAVLEFSRTLASAVLVTTDEVLTEVLAFCSSDQSLRTEAGIVVRGILAARNVRVVPQTHEGFLNGLTLYENRPDKGHSVTEVVENMERETRIELATNSLEDCGSIENKDNLRPWRSILTIKNAAISRLLFFIPLNGVNGVTRVNRQPPAVFCSVNAEECLEHRRKKAGGFGDTKWRHRILNT